MKFYFSFALVFLLFALPCKVNGQEYRLTKAKKNPPNTPKHLSQLLETNGFAISKNKEVLLRLWMRKDIPTVENFKPSYSVQYPFATGELVGMLQIPKGKTYSDFRQQELKAGLYTLRYGHIPEDGNHLGASEISDFLLTLPVAFDKTTKRIKKPKELSHQSSQGVKANHPAIFSLVGADEKQKKKQEAKLKHDEEHEFWVLHFSATIKKVIDKKTTSERIPLRLIVVGFSEE